MIDYTIELFQMCSDLNMHQTWSVGNYQQFKVAGELVCTCQGFKYRKHCKHIKEIEKSMCNWHGCYSDETQTEEQEEMRICPVCGKETVIVRVAV